MPLFTYASEFISIHLVQLVLLYFDDNPFENIVFVIFIDEPDYGEAFLMFVVQAVDCNPQA